MFSVHAAHAQDQWNMPARGVTLPTLLSRVGACAAQDDVKGGRTVGSKGSCSNRAGSKTSYLQLPTQTIDADGEATPSQWSQGSPMHHIQTDFSPMYTRAHHQDAFCFAGAYAMPSPPSAFASAPPMTTAAINTLRAEAAPYMAECARATLVNPYIAEYARVCAEYARMSAAYALASVDYAHVAPAPSPVPSPVPPYPLSHSRLKHPEQLEQPSEKRDGNDVLDAERTSIMIRNLPEGFKRSMVMETLEIQGLAVNVDFIYVPTNLRNEDHFGYAFVNFTSHAAAVECIGKLDGFSDWSVPCAKWCEVTWSLTYQGLHAHVERYRNSRIMHETVDDEYKPAVFVKGDRVEFPFPTKSIRAPRLRKW